jgi:hypothetical protein
MSVLRVGVVLSAGTWGRRLNAFAADHGAGVEVVMVRDAHAVFESGLQVVCVDDSIVWFDRAMVASAETAGITVVGVRSAGDESSDARLAGLGIAHRMHDTVPPGSMLELVARLRPRDRFEEIVADLVDPDGVCSSGMWVTVGGPPGAGAREIAVGVAAGLAGAGSTVLVDCNECSPGVARRLGLGVQPHVIDAVGLVSAGSDLAAVLAGPAEGLGGGGLRFDVIAGLASPGEWTRFPASAAELLIGACRARWRYTVAVTSPIVEDLHRWVDRYGVSRHLLGSSPVVVGVCEASPRGVLRFAEWLAECQPAGRVVAVVNKVSSSRFVGAEVVDRLVSLCGDRVEVAAVVPFDRRVVAGEWDATLPARGPFTKAVARLVDRLLVDVPAVGVGG